MLLLNNLKHLLVIALLIFLQVAIFNNINFLGITNPYFYVIFVLLFPISKNRYVFLLYAFILGISIDFLENTGGVNAFATVFVAYIRYYFIQLINNRRSHEKEEVQLANFSFIQWALYLPLIIFIHHFLVDFMESFTFSRLFPITINGLIGSALTLIMIIVYLMFFPPAKESEY